MKHLKQILLINALLVSACGGGGGESSNSVQPTVDGFLQPLTQDDDSFINTVNNNNKLSSISALRSQDFTASKTIDLALAYNNNRPCAINIYKVYSVNQNSVISTDRESRVMQLSSNNCQYNGPLFLLNQQSKLLIEVIDIENQQTNYSEAKVMENGLSITAL